jgi:hypothetical protein
MMNQQTNKSSNIDVNVNSNSNTNSNSDKIATVVDPVGTGYNVALEIYRREYQLIALWSSSLKEELKCRSFWKGKGSCRS